VSQSSKAKRLLALSAPFGIFISINVIVTFNLLPHFNMRIILSEN